MYDIQGRIKIDLYIAYRLYKDLFFFKFLPTSPSPRGESERFLIDQQVSSGRNVIQAVSIDC